MMHATYCYNMWRDREPLQRSNSYHEFGLPDMLAMYFQRMIPALDAMHSNNKHASSCYSHLQNLLQVGAHTPTYIAHTVAGLQL